MKNHVLPLKLDLGELRRKLIICVCAIAAGVLIAYCFKERLFAVLMKPMIAALPHGGFEKLLYTAPHEAFMTYLKVSLIAGTALAMPLILFELWTLVAPSLCRHERICGFPLLLFSTLFYVAGSLFAYFLVFPQAFKFFTSFSSDHLAPMISIREYLSFSARFLLAFGIIFELPIFIFFLTKLGLIDAKFMRKQRRYAILLIFIVAAVLTPTPDAFTQTLMAGPLLLLYEISIWIAHFTTRKHGKVEGAGLQISSG
ncbi:twin-arginine translocase subunit TatC [Desulfoferrobacter suflitae]|uniref:twin-arginine translocase subunit TatC n=1 Tax=Desulfoferrobacter suflitae TaxID=2865782 RepID=UPI002164701B|nr:twin-arginine translocase subunit TatC [Desulfoferrobacter suflitae]MCK8603648.1 twin-arginine translocase subunit TatC [Desulfoferrobacter suflitae]